MLDFDFISLDGFHVDAECEVGRKVVGATFTQKDAKELVASLMLQVDDAVSLFWKESCI